jgi:uncharacterized lipoprotein YajG
MRIEARLRRTTWRKEMIRLLFLLAAISVIAGCEKPIHEARAPQMMQGAIAPN